MIFNYNNLKIWCMAVKVLWGKKNNRHKSTILPVLEEHGVKAYFYKKILLKFVCFLSVFVNHII